VSELSLEDSFEIENFINIDKIKFDWNLYLINKKDHLYNLF